MPIVGGITFGVAAPMLCGVVDNGVCFNDPRVMVRTNEAQKIVLDYIIPAGGMMTADITAVGTVLTLPKEMLNAIDVEVLNNAGVRNNREVTQGWYEIVNNSLYIDPAAAHDNPLVDLGEIPDPSDLSIFLRKYNYPGLQANAVVRVTGKKRFLPITSNADYLIVQNIEALKLIILSIERYENNAPDDAPKYRSLAFELLQAEVHQYLIDPINSMRRKGAYEDDLVEFDEGSKGWMLARMALELKGALMLGKSELGRILEMAERRLITKGIWKDCIRTFHAEVVHGFIYFPRNVGAILAANLCGTPIDIRPEFFEYQENGPGMDCNGSPMLIDQGDERFVTTGVTRRKYKLNASTSASTLYAVAKLRWVQKESSEQMVIKNFEALRLMCQGIMNERKEDWNQAMADMKAAVFELDSELNDYLRGMKRALPIQDYGFGMGDVGGIL